MYMCIYLCVCVCVCVRALGSVYVFVSVSLLITQHYVVIMLPKKYILCQKYFF